VSSLEREESHGRETWLEVSRQIFFFFFFWKVWGKNQLDAKAWYNGLLSVAVLHYLLFGDMFYSVGCLNVCCLPPTELKKKLQDFRKLLRKR